MNLKLSNIAATFLHELFHKETRESQLFDLFSEDLVFDDINGRRIGKKALEDLLINWLGAFPEWNVKKLGPIEQKKNSLNVKAEGAGVHVNPFKMTQEKLHESSPFCQALGKVKPAKKKLVLTYTLTIVFSKHRIDHVIYSGYDTPFIYHQLELPLLSQCTYETSIEMKVEQVFDFLSRNFQQTIAFPLTKKEVTCLAFALSGFTAKQHAFISSTSPRTIETHLSNAYGKLLCYSKQHCFETMYTNQGLFLFQDLCRLILCQNDPSQIIFLQNSSKDIVTLYNTPH